MRRAILGLGVMLVAGSAAWGDDLGPPARQRVFISPMGEPFRGPDPIATWFAGADANHDGVLTRVEFEQDAARFFARLDRGHDGEIDPDDIDVYENELAPEIRVRGGDGGGRAGGAGGGGRRGGGGGRRGGGMGGGGMGGGGGRGGGRGGGQAGDGESSGGAVKPATEGRQGAARHGWFDYPEPVMVADSDFNRGVSLAEFTRAADQRFAKLDAKGKGQIAAADLPKLDLPTGFGGGAGGRGEGRRGSGARPGGWQGSEGRTRERDPDDDHPIPGQ